MPTMVLNSGDNKTKNSARQTNGQSKQLSTTLKLMKRTCSH
jgi:hypothetical protein